MAAGNKSKAVGAEAAVKKRQKRAREEQEEEAAEAAEEEVPVAEVAEEPAAKKSKKGKKNKDQVMEDSTTASEPVEEADAEEEEAPKKSKKQKAKQDTEVAESNGDAAAAEGAPDVLSAKKFRKKHFITAAGENQVLPDPVQRFEDAPFGKKAIAALKAAFPAPTPIQAQAWPIAVEGNDLVAIAKTGSGKTLGFLLPAFKQISESEASALSVLVLAPTRELVSQIEVECKKFESHSKVTSAAVFGGAPKGPQVAAVKAKPQVLIATPGRLQDLMEMGVVSLKKVQYVVLDEADRMLDMGFEPEIKKILDTTPASRQTLLFSATWPKAVQRIATNYLKAEHVRVNVGQTEELAANKAVSQEFFAIGDDEKEVKLWRIIADLPEQAKLICFMNTKRRVVALKKAFWERGYEAAELHGDRAQRDRDYDLARFAKGDVWLLFATDVCARGLDIRGVTHVVNYDMARDVESYVHRIGRTGRAGASGTSITFWNEAYDMECAPALVKIAQDAGQVAPDWLQKAASKQAQVKNKLWKY